MKRTGTAIEQVVPHAGAMCLLDEVEDFGDDWLRASATIGEDNLFVENGVVPSWVGIEYMAQAVAAWAGSCAVQRGEAAKIGFLVGTRLFEVSRPEFPVASALKIHVRVKLLGDNGLGAFACEIRGADPAGKEFTATASLNVYQPQDIGSILGDSQ